MLIQCCWAAFYLSKLVQCHNIRSISYFNFNFKIVYLTYFHWYKVNTYKKYIYKYVGRLLLRYVHTACVGVTQRTQVCTHSIELKTKIDITKWVRVLYVIICPASTKLKGGYTGFTLSVCGQNRVRSVSSTILVGSISYLHILSSNFRSCVVCKVCIKIKNLKFWQILKFVSLTSSFVLGSNLTQYYG